MIAMVWVLVGLCLVGFGISSYFTGVAYRWVAPDTRWIPAVCRMGERTCATIVFTRRAHVFGIPNSVLGQLFYALLAMVAVAGGLNEPVLRLVLIAVSGLTVLLGLYLTYSLLFVTRVNCVLCFTSHAINVVLFVTLLQ
jgi:uncharacterized membrane protein